ncbi:methyltransferase [Candidatus Kaiserbacteria bacterium RIFCSPLOWO2_01_FULL_54_13]|uniref:Methyltransferase n=1 Tax=Candidatus Kaiserbacteria bacterium RIFCSPLOWO2_01_FULL_54_13 TaxID=1798512 RepID=A0A1F6F2G8_9BACT|nr:MAG: methyltransferase [Candidatus Kaiserbacteria bacterium RIFCSPLOWO2_01_FULL_54_13]
MQCLLCKSEPVEFLDLGKQPLANKYPKKEDFEKEDFFPLTVHFCPACKNVQLGTVISRERMFEDYYYLSSVNQALVRHFEQLAKKLSKAKFVVDIGSNDGILLKPLKELGVKALGVEPSVNVSKIANDKGLETINAFFDAPTVEKIVKERGMADVVVTSSVFTHLEDPHTFTENVKNLMTDDGVFIIEVEYIGNILRDVQFERFYLDRIFYYSLTSLAHFFESHGMCIEDVEHIEPHGGSIRVYVRTEEIAPSKNVVRLLEKEKTELTLATLEKFKQRVNESIAAFREKLQEYKDAGFKVAGYGAPARVATITNYGKIGPDLIAFIVDDSPLKQNRFSPGMHIPIVPKTHLDEQERKPEVLVVFAYEYLDDIKKKTSGGNYRYLIPIPPREV